jgi:hypothetical protein
MNDTTNTTTLPVPAQEVEKLPALLQKSLPLLEKWKARADAALDEIQVINNKEEAEEAIAILAAVRDVYNKQYETRKEMTDLTDAFKDVVMEFERPFNPDAKAKSKYNEKKKILEAWQQKELDRIQQEKVEAAKKKELENHKIDLRTKILENLNNMLVDVVKKSDTGSKDFFAASTLETFDARAEQFKGINPKLKQEFYNACFASVTPNTGIIRADELGTLVEELKKEHSYDIWNTKFQEQVAPIVNQWRARIPELKQQLLDVAELAKKNQEEAEALKKKQQEAEEQASKDRQTQLDLAADQAKAKVVEDANMDKMSNEFASQALSQTIGDPGRTKLVLKFIDPKLAGKAFMEIMYHVMSHPDFQQQYPCFQRRDAKKKLMVDDKGRPVYIEHVQWWIDWFLDNCNAAITGTIISEDAKVVIRK